MTLPAPSDFSLGDLRSELNSVKANALALCDLLVSTFGVEELEECDGDIIGLMEACGWKQPKREFTVDAVIQLDVQLTVTAASHEEAEELARDVLSAMADDMWCDDVIDTSIDIRSVEPAR